MTVTFCATRWCCALAVVRRAQRGRGVPGSRARQGRPPPLCEHLFTCSLIDYLPASPRAPSPLFLVCQNNSLCLFFWSCCVLTKPASRVVYAAAFLSEGERQACQLARGASVGIVLGWLLKSRVVRACCLSLERFNLWVTPAPLSAACCRTRLVLQYPARPCVIQTLSQQRYSKLVPVGSPSSSRSVVLGSQFSDLIHSVLPWSHK